MTVGALLLVGLSVGLSVPLWEAMRNAGRPSVIVGIEVVNRGAETIEVFSLNLESEELSKPLEVKSQGTGELPPFRVHSRELATKARMLIIVVNTVTGVVTSKQLTEDMITDSRKYHPTFVYYVGG